MGLIDPAGGGSYVQGQNFPPGALSIIANQQPQAVDGNVGTDLSLDQDYTLAMADGTTYRATMTLTGHRIIWLPIVGNTVAERVSLRFDCNCGGFTLTMSQVAGSDVASITGGGAVTGAVEMFWHTTNSRWYCLGWTSGITVIS